MEPAFVSVIDLFGNGDSGQSKINFRFFVFVTDRRLFNFCHWRLLEITDAVIVIDRTINAKEVCITGLAAVIVCSQGWQW